MRLSPLKIVEILLINCLCLTALTASLRTDAPIFKPVKIDGPVHDPANHTYWYGPFSECASVADLDGDGDLDIAAGRTWYEAPHWTRHIGFRDGARVNGPEVENNSEFAMDVDFDGDMDIVSSGWMRDMGAFWYENPGPETVKTGVRWKRYRIHTGRSLEGVIHGDIDRDGDEDILVNHWMLEPNQGMTWLEHIDKAPWFVEHVIGSDADTHGNGLGDVNSDGRMDIVTRSGWYENPEASAKDDWTFHADYEFNAYAGSTMCSHPILVLDVDGDGLNDIICGAGHSYGLAVMMQNKGANGKRTFKQEWVETDVGQFHTMTMGDLDGDGKQDVLTGKRLFAHHGRDVSTYDPLAVFWYDTKDGKLNRNVMAYNYLQKMEDDLTARNPAPNFVPSVGMKINIKDMNADGRNDAVICGKGGLYIFYNYGKPNREKPPHRLPPEDNYPTWDQWRQFPTPERPDIPRKIHGDGPAPADYTRPQAAARASAPKDAWINLFNGSNLDQWIKGPDRSWVIEDGVITLRRAFDGKEHNYDYLWTKRQFNDFVLELEFKVPQRANSGIFLRTPDLMDPVYTGIEVQVNNSYGRKDLSRGGTAGAIYDIQAPTKNTIKRPGEWNHYRITCQGPEITVELNGETINEVDVDRWTEPNKNPDGSENKFGIALKDFARRGHIGLQDHGRQVWYRNIRVKPLN